MKRVLITGGAGFIGSSIAGQLSSAGIEVVVLDNLSSGYRINTDGMRGVCLVAFQMLRGEPITVFGDGEQTRDFVNVSDVAQANIKSALAPGVSGAFNIGSGTRISINALLDILSVASGMHPVVQHSASRPGDVRHSLADISAARKAFGFEPNVELANGLTEYIGWVQKELHN